MVIGEDKSKVLNIVKENLPHFRMLYSHILQECPQVVYKPQQGKLEVRLAPQGIVCFLLPLSQSGEREKAQTVWHLLIMYQIAGLGVGGGGGGGRSCWNCSVSLLLLTLMVSLQL